MTENDAIWLLRDWCGALIAHQVPAGLPGLSGGVLCPACCRIHGRSGDAVYPLLLLYGRTGEAAYRDAARALFDWSADAPTRPDGSWANEVVSGATPWKGITCFSVIALGEALHHHGALLPDEDRDRWTRRLARGADFLLTFADTLAERPSIDVNYVVSTAAALACAGTVLGDARYQETAGELARQGLGFFTEGGLYWGEGGRGPAALSPRGLRGIDPGYNVEESLPNLALYGALCGDEEALDAAARSFAAHLDLLLPDGAWDAGWGSRQFKWTYWGSRTSDGCAGGLLLLKDRDPRFAPAAARNLRLLSECTHDGVLYGGPHLHARGMTPCIHHTICHAKGLAAALDAGWPETDGAADAVPLPRDGARGVRAVLEAALHLADVGPWRATISAYDYPYRDQRACQPGGGSPAVLWHEEAGPLAAASMNEYDLLEAANMQAAWTPEDRACLTPRLEQREGDAVYSNVYDPTAEVRVVTATAGAAELRAEGRLADQNGQDPPGGRCAFALTYRFDADSVTLEASLTADAPGGAELHFPLVSEAAEPAAWQNGALEVRKPGATVRLEASTAPMSEDTGRVFQFVPGFEAVPAHFALVPGGTVRLRITVE
jgi:hypothetical protein